jgi:hypothetical protein
MKNVNKSITSTPLLKSKRLINRSIHKHIADKCFNDKEFRNTSSHAAVDTSSVFGTRDAMVVWTHAITMQMQELLERVDSLTSKGCLIDNVEQVFMQYLIYTKRLRKYMRVKIMINK